jgi:hypothetical protein
MRCAQLLQVSLVRRVEAFRHGQLKRIAMVQLDMQKRSLVGTARQLLVEFESPNHHQRNPARAPRREDGHPLNELSQSWSRMQSSCWEHNLKLIRSFKRVATMTWKQLRPIVWKLDNQYERGKKLTKSQMKTISQRLQRLTGLERWCVMIRPVVVQMT